MINTIEKMGSCFIRISKPFWDSAPNKNGGCNERVRVGFGLLDVHLVPACRGEQWPHGSIGASACAAKGCLPAVLRQQPAADRLRDLLPGARGRVQSVRSDCRPHAAHRAEAR